jgi:hypothetical protein
MRFGTPVIVRRGGSARTGPGCARDVRGVLIGAKGCHTRVVRLTEDDPLSTIPEWSHAGDVGYWSPSVVRKDETR